jgi:hypothetical protein
LDCVDWVFEFNRWTVYFRKIPKAVGIKGGNQVDEIANHNGKEHKNPYQKKQCEYILVQQFSTNQEAGQHSNAFDFL